MHARRAGRLPFLATHVVALVWPRARRPRALFRSASRDAHQWFAPLGRSGTGRISTIGNRKARRCHLSRRLVCALRKIEQPFSARVSVLPLLFVGALLALIVCEVDLGTTALIGATAFAMMFIAGTNPVLLGFVSLGGIASIALVATKMPERMARLTAFRDLKAYQQTDGLQQMQALIAWGSGGMEGLGLGNGRQKMLYLPYAHTDFIFPMIGEELGLARQSARRLFVRRHHRLRNDDRAPCEGPFRIVACERCRLASRLASRGQHRRHHFAFA